MKNSNDTIGNGTRDLPVCSAVPQPTGPPRALYMYIYYTISLQVATLLRLLDPEDAVITNCRNVGMYQSTPYQIPHLYFHQFHRIPHCGYCGFTLHGLACTTEW